MIHDRHFTVEEANDLLPQLTPLLQRLRDAKERLTDEEVRAALEEAAPANGGGEPGRHVGEAFLELRSLVVAVQDAGIVIRDIDRGLVDFPAVMGSEEVYLCWELGEDRVEHWHDLESGYGDREPLEP